MLLKKYVISQVFLTFAFIYKYVEHISNQKIWYDDAHELLISRASLLDFNSFNIISDHHLGFSIFLKFILNFISIDNIYIFLMVLNLFLIALAFYLISKYTNEVWIVQIGQLSLFFSTVFIDYIFRPKQYIFDYVIAIFLILFLAKFINESVIVYFAFLLFTIFSNTLALYFLYPILKNLLKNIKSIKSLFTYFGLSIVAYFLLYNGYNKIVDSNFRDYWRSYYSETNLFTDLIYRNFMFLRNYLDFGFLSIFLLLICIGSYLLFKENKELFTILITPFIVLNVGSLFSLYPLGAGRTDIIIFPLISFAIIYFFKFFNFNKVKPLLFFGLLIVLLYTNVNLIEREDNSEEIFNSISIAEYDKVYISYYSIPQFVLYREDLGLLNSRLNECNYKSKDARVKFLANGYNDEDRCQIKTDLNEIVNEINGQKIAILGFDSKTQRLLAFTSSLDKNSYKINVIEFGTQEYIIEIDSK